MGLLLALLLAQPVLTPTNVGGPIIASGSRFAFFEFAPLGGIGMPAACTGTTPTGAKGEPATFVRATAATCLKGNTSTGIVVGDLVKLTSGQPRVMPGIAGTANGILIENAGTNLALRSEELGNAAWVATAAVTNDTFVAPDGTTTAEQLNDASGAASQGVTQAITTGSLTRHAISCFNRAGTASSVTLTLTGTGNSAGDTTCSNAALSGTTYDRVCCVSAAPYAAGLTAVTFAVLVGNGVGVTGTIGAWGCQHEVGSMGYCSSYIPTTSASATRNVETISFAGPWPTSASISTAGTFVGPQPASGGAASMMEFNGLPSLFNENGNLIRWMNATGMTVANASGAAGLRWYGFHSGTARGMAWGANTNSGAEVAAANKFGATLFIGGSGCAGGCPADGVIKAFCVDADSARCR